MIERTKEIEAHLAKGLTTSRMQSLSDNVFAFAMTLLILNLVIPSDLPSEHLDELFINLWPQFLTYFMSFMVLGIFWVSAHNIFHWIKHLDRKSLWIHILFMSFVALIPFTTAILRSYYMEQIAVTTYGINLIICGLMLYWLWLHVSKGNQLLIDEATTEVVSTMKFRILVPTVVAVAVTLLSFVSPILSLFMFAGLFILVTIPSNSDHIVTLFTNFLHKKMRP